MCGVFKTKKKTSKGEYGLLKTFTEQGLAGVVLQTTDPLSHNISASSYIAEWS